MKLKPDTWFIDNKNGAIYYFDNITTDKIIGFVFQRNKFLGKGEWNKKEWISIVKKSRPERFKVLKSPGTELSSGRKHTMMRNTFK